MYPDTNFVVILLNKNFCQNNHEMVDFKINHYKLFFTNNFLILPKTFQLMLGRKVNGKLKDTVVVGRECDAYYE